MKRLGILAALVLLSGCGALFNGSPAKVNFTSTPEGADVLIDGTRRGTTPVVLDLQKNKDYTVVFKKNGYREITAVLSKKVSGTYIVLDVLGGLIPVVVDAATGSWYVLSTDAMHASLEVATTAQGTLTPEQLAAVKAGTPASEFISMADVLAAPR